MDRYWQANAVIDAPATPSDNAGGFPANGNPVVGIPGTVPGERWYHALTEELRNTIIALGGTPDFTQVNQLAAVLANTFAQTTQNIMAQLARVATSGQYEDLPGLPNLAVVALTGDFADLSGTPDLAAVATSGDFADLSGTPQPFELLPATTETLGGIKAGPGTMVAADGTLRALGEVLTVSRQGLDTQGNCTVQALDAASIGAGPVLLINQGGATSGNILLKSLENGTGVALTDHSSNIEIDIALSANAGNVITVGSDHGLFVPATGPASAADVVSYLRANGTPITKTVVWGMGSLVIAHGPGNVAASASVTVGTESFTLLTIAAGTYDIEMAQNWQWLSGVTTGNAAGSSINLMKSTLGSDLTTVQSITSMNVFQSLFANANTVQQVAQRSVFHDVVIAANPLVQYGMVAQFINGQASQSASLSSYVASVNPSDGTVATASPSAGLTVRFTPKH